MSPNGHVRDSINNIATRHWPVRDDAAARLTVVSVRDEAHGLDRPEALRRLMLGLINARTVPGSALPATWAPFIGIED